MKILIVDDFFNTVPDNQKFVRDLGLNNTHEADDGNTALPMLKMVILILLSQTGTCPHAGIDLLKAIRADESLRHLPVLMVTAAKREQIIEAVSGGREWIYR